MSDIRESLKKYNQKQYGKILTFFQFIPESIEQGAIISCSQIINLFDINGELKIHPLALKALKKDDKLEILKKTEQIKKGELVLSKTISTDNKKFVKILKDHELQLDREIFEQENELSDLFECNLRTWTTPDKIKLFSNIKPYEIKRLSGLFHNNAKLKKNLRETLNFLDLPIKNVSDFSACLDYMFRELENYTKRENDIETKEAKEKDFIDRLKTEKERRESFKRKFMTLVMKCDELMKKEDLDFSSAMTFANHFDKHGVKMCPPDSVNAETYLRLANEHVRQGQTRVTVLLSQDGTALKHTYEYDEKIAVVIEEVKSERKCIATFFKKKSRKIIL